MNISEKKEKKMNMLKKLGLYTFFVTASGSLTLVGAEGNWQKIASIRTTNDLPNLFSKDSANITSASFSVAHQLRDALAAARAGNQAEAQRLLSLARQGMKVLQAERASFGGIDPLAALLSEETLKFVDAQVNDAIAAQKQAVTEEVSAPSAEELARERKEKEEIERRAAEQAAQAERDRLAADAQRRQEEDAAAQRRKLEDDAQRARLASDEAAARLAAQRLADVQARAAAEKAAAIKRSEGEAKLQRDIALAELKAVEDLVPLVLNSKYLNQAFKGLTWTKEAYSELIDAKDLYLRGIGVLAALDSLIASDWFKTLDGQEQQQYKDDRDAQEKVLDQFDKDLKHLQDRFELYRIMLAMDDLVKKVKMQPWDGMKQSLAANLTTYRSRIPYNAAYTYGTAWYQASQAEKDQENELAKAIVIAKKLDAEYKAAAALK